MYTKASFKYCHIYQEALKNILRFLCDCFTNISEKWFETPTTFFAIYPKLPIFSANEGKNFKRRPFWKSTISHNFNRDFKLIELELLSLQFNAQKYRHKFIGFYLEKFMVVLEISFLIVFYLFNFPCIAPNF